MRIAIFSEAYQPQVNGVVRTQVELVAYLRGRGHAVLEVVPFYKSNPVRKMWWSSGASPFRYIRKCPLFSRIGDFIGEHWKECTPLNPIWFI